MKHNKSCGHTLKIVASLIAHIFGIIHFSQAAGVTIITHGYNDTAQSGWIPAMVNAIINRTFHGDSQQVSVYQVYVTQHSSGDLIVSHNALIGGNPLLTASGEILVELDWSTLTSINPLYFHSTKDIAKVVVAALTDPNFINDMGGKPLSSLPIHLIGHSRGGSLVCEISRILGQQGIWVHQLTTLDPHPVCIDSGDGAANAYENVLFADNIYQTVTGSPNCDPLDPLGPSGVYVDGASYRILTSLNGGYPVDSPVDYSAHLDVHLWYHGTVDTSTSASDGSASFTSAMRNTWYSSYEFAGEFAGFYYSRLGGGLTDDSGPFFGLYNEGNFNNYPPDNRVALAVRTSQEWPSIIQFSHDATGSVMAGNVFNVQLVVQSYDSGCSISVYLDPDQNPYNGNQTALPITSAINPQPSTASKTPTINTGVTVPSTTRPGVYYIYAMITNPHGTRYLYSLNPIQVLGNTGSLMVNLSPSAVTSAGAEWVLNGINHFSGDVVSALPAGQYSVSFTPVSGYTTPANMNVTINANAQTTASGTYTANVGGTGSVVVNLFPSGAIAAGAEWVLNGVYHHSGDVIVSLTPGQYTVSFTSVSGYTTPANINVTINANQQTTASATYTASVGGTGSLVVNLFPSGAIAGGAEWVLNGVYHHSGDVIVSLTPGQYTVSFTSVSGYTTPANMNVTINANAQTTASGTYTANVGGTGSVVVNLFPSGAIAAGAEWVLNGVYHHSGDVIVSLTPGQYTVSFTSVSGYTTPANINVTINANQQTTASATYTASVGGTGSLVVNLFPSGAIAAGAEWVLNGLYHHSGDVVTSLTPGPYTISFTSVSGYTTPASINVTVPANQEISANISYSAIVLNNGSISVYIYPAAAISAGAQWCLDGGNYHNSGEMVNNLAPGLHTISSKPISGYFVPANISVLVASGTSYGYAVSYQAAYNIVASVSPSNAGTFLGAGMFQASDVASVVATPATNYKFVSWTENGTVVSTSPAYTFDIESNRNLVANFIFWGPSYFSPTAASQNSIGLTWDSYSNSQAYLIIEKTNASTGLFESVSRLPFGTTVWVDTNVVPNNNYSYRIRSWDGSLNYSAYSSVAAANTQFAMSLGAPVTLVNGTADYRAIASDNDSVYWSSILLDAGGSLPGGSSIWKASKADGSLVPLVTGLANPVLAIVVYSNYIYWAETGIAYSEGPNPPTAGAIKMMPVNGGSITIITSNGTMGQGIGILGLAVDQSGVYWTEGGLPVWDYTGQLRGVVGVPVDNPTLLSQAAPITFADKLFAPYGLSQDADFLYWIETDPITSVTNRGSLKRVSKLGGSPTILATNLAEVDGIAVDSTDVFFHTGYSISKILKSGGIPTTLCYADMLGVVYDTFVYYSFGDQIRRVQKDGSSISTLASGLNLARAITADSTGVYWTDYSWQDSKVGLFSEVIPTITVQPENQITTTNVTVVFNVVAKGAPPLNYQWQMNGTNLVNGGSINGATNSVLIVTNVQPRNSGNYAVIVTNNFGAVTSLPPAILIVDGQKPTNQIVFPIAGARLSNTLCAITGKAGDNFAVSNVYYQVNSAGWNMPTTTNNWTNWMVLVNLFPGTNLVETYAIDWAGNKSLTNTVRFDFVLTNQLHVRAIGLGTISPNYSNAWLEIGRNYCITSTPASGFVATNWMVSTNWLGSAATNSRVVLFMMQSNLTLQVDFEDVTRPTNTIIAPTNGQHMTNALATVVGKSADNWKVAGVWYQLNNSAWCLAPTTNWWTNWTTTLELTTGTNTVKSYAMDLAGNLSTTSTVSVISSNTFKLQFAVTNYVALRTNGVTFRLELSAGLNGHIEVSTNLVYWAPLTYFVGTNAVITFHDLATTNVTHKFYRAVVP